MLAVAFPYLTLGKGENAPNNDNILARVGDQAITLSDFQIRKNFLTAYFPNLRNTETDIDRNLNLNLLNNLIDEEILVQEAKRRGVMLSDSEFQTALKRATDTFLDSNIAGFLYTLNISLDDWHKMFQKRLVVEKLTASLFAAAPLPSEKDARSYYKDHEKDFNEPEMREVGHLQVRTAEVAELSLTYLKQNKQFSELVTAFSNAADRSYGGSLGWVARGELPTNLEGTVFSLEKIGEVSKPVETPYGFHIFKLTGLKPARKLPFEEAKQQIFKILSEKNKNEVFTSFFEKLKKDYVVTRFTEKLDHYNDI